MTRTDLYEKITSKIIFDMEKGVLPWMKNWKGRSESGLRLPSNGITKRPYRGINIMLLWGAAEECGSSDMRFATFKQISAAGGHVLKGSTGYKVYFFKPMIGHKVRDDGSDEAYKWLMLREFTVFHLASQTEGLDLKVEEKGSEELPADTEEFIGALSMCITHGGDRACYIPSRDVVQMPWCDDFANRDAYRSTLYHETIHWSGSEKRLNRLIRNRFGSPDYAREELVAELGAAFICAEYGIEYSTQHASYIDSWLKVLKEDSKAILQAASAAQKAVDYIREKVAGENAQGEGEED